ncbi:autorepressor SdpR family transcription factor [Calditerricola yamamurae]|jgi:Predicted transcriptional regulators
MGLSDVFKALADPTRRAILDLLKGGDRTAGEIAERFSISKPSISHHLNVLKQANLVQDERRGQHVVYSLNTTVFHEVLKWMLTLAKAKGGKE